jgi:hypothetical protein
MHTVLSTEKSRRSVERMISYAELPPEAPARIPETTPTQPWPNDGVIEFRCAFPVTRLSVV